MKLIHLSDLHIGKKVNEFSMIEDQRYILNRILNIIDEEKADAILLAGDIYDKSVPGVEALGLFNDFLEQLDARKVPTFVISGNHDAAERIAFGRKLMDYSVVHISPAYDGKVKPFTLKDDGGSVNIYMLPFIKPIHVRQAFPEEEIDSYTDAVKVAIDHMDVDTSQRNVLIAHQFVTGAERSESEEISVGGLDNVDVSVFDDFDYVALGHLHGPQTLAGGRVRYCGTPLKYSFSERGQEKSVSVITLGEKEEDGSKCFLDIRTVPLKAVRDMQQIRGTFSELMGNPYGEDSETTQAYLHIVLTDEDFVINAMNRLRAIYPNIMRLDYDNRRTAATEKVEELKSIEKQSPIEVFSNLFEYQNNQEMNQKQKELINKLIEEIWEEE